MAEQEKNFLQQLIDWKASYDQLREHFSPLVVVSIAVPVALLALLAAGARLSRDWEDVKKLSWIKWLIERLKRIINWLKRIIIRQPERLTLTIAVAHLDNDERDGAARRGRRRLSQSLEGTDPRTRVARMGLHPE